MIIQSVVSILRSELETTEVFGALEFLDIRENHAYTESPTFYVLPNTQTSSQTPGAQEDDFTVDQVVRVVVMVDIACSDHRAEAAHYDARDQRDRLFSALLGRQLADCFYPMTFVSGQELGRDGKRIFYAYDFNVREQLSIAASGYIEDAQMRELSITLKAGTFEGRPHGKAESCPGSGSDCP